MIARILLLLMPNTKWAKWDLYPNKYSFTQYNMYIDCNHIIQVICPCVHVSRWVSFRARGESRFNSDDVEHDKNMIDRLKSSEIQSYTRTGNGQSGTETLNHCYCCLPQSHGLLLLDAGRCLLVNWDYNQEGMEIGFSLCPPSSLIQAHNYSFSLAQVKWLIIYLILSNSFILCCFHPRLHVTF